MSASIPAPPQANVQERPPRTLWGDAWRRFRRDRLALFGTATLLLIILGCVVGPLIYTASPSQIDFSRSQLPPRCWQHALSSL